MDSKSYANTKPQYVQVKSKPAPTVETKPKQVVTEVPQSCRRLSRRYVGGGEWELIESTWEGPPTQTRLIKRGVWSVLKDHALLWYKAMMGPNGVGDLE